MKTPANLLGQPYQQFGYDGQPLDFSEPRVWAAFIARHPKEEAAFDRLREFRLFAYWPNYPRHMNSGNGRRRTEFAAIIPGMIFVAVREGSNCDPWNILRQTPGIIGYLRNGSGAPALLTNYDIETIRGIEAGQNIPPPVDWLHTFKPGDIVRFVDDILGQWPPGKVKALETGNRIVVETLMMGRVVPITVNPRQIEAM